MAKHSPRITEFTAKGPDFFTARLDNGGARVGMVGGPWVNVPAGHPSHAAIVGCTTEAEAEACFDVVYGATL